MSKECESICRKNLELLVDNINSVRFILCSCEKHLPSQDLTINDLFLTDKDLGKKCVESLVKQIRYQLKLFIQKLIDKANVNGSLNLFWHESGATDLDLQVMKNDGTACISLNPRQSVINCESLVKLTDELLGITGFDKLQLLEGKNGCEADDESNSIPESFSVPVALDKTVEDHEDFEEICGLGFVNGGYASDYFVNSNSGKSESDVTQERESRVVSDESDSSESLILPDGLRELQLIEWKDLRKVNDESDIFSEPCIVDLEKTTPDREDFGSLLSTHSSHTCFLSNTEINGLDCVNDDNSTDHSVNSTLDNSKSDESEQSGNSDNENRTMQDCEDLYSPLSTLRSETDISSQGFVNDDNASDYPANYKSDNSDESDESEENVGRLVDDKSDSRESVIFHEPSLVSENKTTEDSNDLDSLSSTHRLETDISSEGFVDDDNASDYSVN